MSFIGVRCQLWFWLVLLWLSDSVSSVLVKALPYSVAMLLIARGVAAILLGIVRNRGKLRLSYNRQTLRFAGWFALACGAYYGAVKAWHVSEAIAVLTAAPAWILLRDALKSRIPFQRIIADLFLVGGIACFVWPARGSASFPPMGVLLAVISAIATAEFYLASRQVSRLSSPERLSWLGLSVLLAGIVILSFLPSGTYAMTSSLAWLMALPAWCILPIFGTFAGGLYFLATERLIAIEPKLAGSLAMTKTIIVILVSRWLLHESNSTRQLIGLMVGVIGSVLIALIVSLRSRNEPGRSSL